MASVNVSYRRFVAAAGVPVVSNLPRESTWRPAVNRTRRNHKHNSAVEQIEDQQCKSSLVRKTGLQPGSAMLQ